MTDKRTSPTNAERPLWECMGRKQSLPEPGECNWPDCGCDDRATKVIESLLEQGWLGPQEAQRLSADRDFFAEKLNVALGAKEKAEAALATSSAEIADAEKWQDKYCEEAFYEIGGVPHKWEARAIAAEARVKELSAENARLRTPCGECHIQPGETCDICGRSA